MKADNEGPEQLRMITKVARLYHNRDMRQREIAERLGVSQARVSRLLKAAHDAKIVQTIVVVPRGLHVELEEAMEIKFGLQEVHIVDVVDDDEAELALYLGSAVASVLQVFPIDAQTIGFTSWSRALRGMAAALPRLHNSSAVKVVEMLGDVGPSPIQHKATDATQRLAAELGAIPLFLRVPGVVTSSEVRDAIVGHDLHAQLALRELNNLDLALVGIGNCEIVSPLVAGDNFFSEEQFAYAKEQGAVGQVNLRFINALGEPVAKPLDNLVIGITLDQLRSTPRRLGVAGGPSKYDAIHAALTGGWVNSLVTDVGTAQNLLARESTTRQVTA